MTVEDFRNRYMDGKMPTKRQEMAIKAWLSCEAMIFAFGVQGGKSTVMRAIVRHIRDNELKHWREDPFWNHTHAMLDPNVRT